MCLQSNATQEGSHVLLQVGTTKKESCTNFIHFKKRTLRKSTWAIGGRGLCGIHFLQN